MKQTFTLKRSGKFPIKTVPGTPHCGISDRFDIQYKFSCICDVTSLDDRGFLFDQMRIGKYFEGQIAFPVSISCEQYALKCARELFKLIVAENKGCQVSSMTLTLSPAPFVASMTYTVEAEPGQYIGTQKKEAVSAK